MVGSGTYVILGDESSSVDFLTQTIHREKGKLSEIFQFRRMIEPQIERLASLNVGKDKKNWKNWKLLFDAQKRPQAV